MRVLVLGAAGFIGSHLAATLRQRGALRSRGITELLLADNRPVAGGVQGDICDAAFLQQLFAQPVDAAPALPASPWPRL